MKRITICADGTWNRPDQRDRGERNPSNVVKIARGVRPLAADGAPQVVFYHKGLGTHWGADRVLGGGFGHGLSRNIINCYEFAALNYEPGDEFYFFGFSRGAYTVRSLAGLIEKIGILPKDEIFFMPEAYTLYRNAAPVGVTNQFRTEHRCLQPTISYLGVWDTVGALGIPLGIFDTLTQRRYGFHDVTLGSCVGAARHALAIDERRKPFRPTLWRGEGDRVEQRWFIGVHTNVGGGYEKDGSANIPLHWVKDGAAELGWEFDEEFLAHYRPYHKDELRDSMSLKYRILGEYIRPVALTGDSNETIDSSVYKRIEDPALDYAPRNVPMN